MQPVTLRLTRKTSSAQTYHFAPADSEDRHFGWALATVNDLTGELQIMSDWGNWAHRWNTRHLGSPTLTDFIANRDDVGYLADKLLGSTDGKEFSSEATSAHLVERLREMGMDEGVFEELRHDLEGELASIGDGEQAAALYAERLPGEIHDHLSDIHESFQYRETSESKILRQTVLPALVAACTEEVEQRRLAQQAESERAAVEAAEVAGEIAAWKPVSRG